MKKTILIMLLILPVVIVSLAYIIAGVVHRHSEVPPITGLEITSDIVMNDHGILLTQEDDGVIMTVAQGWNVGRVIPLASFLRPTPHHPLSTLESMDFIIILSNPLDEGALTITSQGVITIERLPLGYIIIEIRHTVALFFVIEW